MRKLESFENISKSPAVASKTGKKMKKYLPVSEPTDYPYTLFIDTLAVVFEGHHIL